MWCESPEKRVTVKRTRRLAKLSFFEITQKTVLTHRKSLSFCSSEFVMHEPAERICETRRSTQGIPTFHIFGGSSKFPRSESKFTRGVVSKSQQTASELAAGAHLRGARHRVTGPLFSCSASSKASLPLELLDSATSLSSWSSLCWLTWNQSMLFLKITSTLTVDSL